MTKLLDNIYVINLDRSHDRLANIKRNLLTCDIKFHRFAAIDGKQLTDKKISESTSLFCRTFLCNYAIVKCALSHISLWSKLVDDKADYYIIMEDDAIIDNNFSTANHKCQILEQHTINIVFSHRTCTALFGQVYDENKTLEKLKE